jgi:GT2 family glycosyltransferase
MTPKAAVIIPHYNDPARLGLCLGALVAQAEAADVEIVVADNNSPADLAPLTAEFPTVRFVTEPRKGAAEARNRGVAETTAPWLFFIDSDCIAAPDWLATALCLGLGDEVVGGRVEVFDETPPPRSGAEAFETVFAFSQQAYVEQKGFSVTANLLTTRAVFEAVGGFRNGTSEDLEWCSRATAAGYPIRYVDTLGVSHPTRSDWPALEKKWRRLAAEAFEAYRRSPAGRLAWAARAFVVLVSGPAHVPKVLRHPELSALEKRRGATMLVRLRTRRCGWMLRQAFAGR